MCALWKNGNVFDGGKTGSEELRYFEPRRVPVAAHGGGVSVGSRRW